VTSFSQFTPLGKIGEEKTVEFQVVKLVFKKTIRITATGFAPVGEATLVVNENAYTNTSLDDLRERRRACPCPA
jgi:hypothetical protein